MFTGLKSAQVSTVALEDPEHYSYMEFTLEMIILLPYLSLCNFVVLLIKSDVWSLAD